jgi:predicted Rossmann fold flavoprotein
VKLASRVKSLRRLHGENEAPQFEIAMKDGSNIRADRVLLATGSSAAGYEMAYALGHTIFAPMPSLFTFKIKDERLAGMAGISFEDAQLDLKVGEVSFDFRGPLLITHWGLSGPAVLKLSAWGARRLFLAKYQADLSVDLLPHLSRETISENLQRYREEHPKRAVAAHPLFEIPKRYWEKLTTAATVEPEQTWAHISRTETAALIDQLKQGQFRVTGKGEFKEEFVTAGGIKLKEVDFRTMQSRICPGLFFAGEILDIDGITGGYNFQAAWSTGWIAGQALVDE